MNQLPKVYYKFYCSSFFFDPIPIFKENEIGKFRLEDEVLVIEFKENLKTIEEYRLIAKPILLSWQMEAKLTNYPAGNFNFRFWKAELPYLVLDSNENHQEDIIYQKNTFEDLIVAVKAYPPFPRTLYTCEMEAAWNRYLKAKTGIGESIQSAAYYALTVAVKFTGKNFKNAAKTLLIDFGIFKKIGELTSIRGSKNTARKSLGVSYLDLTNKEALWLDYAIRSVFIQIGAINFGDSPTPLKFHDLPKLES